METETVTTPFGRRPISLALIRRQKAWADITPGKSVEKWKVFRDVSAAMGLLGIQSNSVAVLDALLTFYPDNELRQGGQLVVFPSNSQLALRAHGMAGATLRRHLAVLVEAGLIVRKDSANGKRYARKDSEGEISSAFGFDLTPMLSRSEEFASLAQQVAADRAALRNAKESLTICRRDVRKLITAGIEEGAAGDWGTLEEEYVMLVAQIPRIATVTELASILGELQRLRIGIVNRLENQSFPENMSSNGAHNERHIQNSKSETYTELEPALERKQGEASVVPKAARSDGSKTFPLTLVLRACPAISDYAVGGVRNWRDLMSAAVTVRSMLGISPSAYQGACETMGPENAATAVACILERASFINSPGGYLRDLVRRSERGEFSLGPMIMALLNANGHGGMKAG